MYRKEEDRYDSRGRSYQSRKDSDDDGEHRASRKSRGRWDDRRSGANDRHEQSRSSRWDESGSSGRKDKNDRGRQSGGSRWEDKGRTEGAKATGNFWSKSGPRDQRSRSRSKSPFSRNSSNYLNCSNPTKEETFSDKKGDSSTYISSHASSRSEPSKKASSWSDSSDEDVKPDMKNKRMCGHAVPYDTVAGDLNTNSNHQANPYTEYGHLRGQFGAGEIGKYDMPSNYAITKTSSETETETGRTGTGPPSGISLKLGGGPSSKPLPLPKVISVSVPVKSTRVSSVFNSDDDDEPEEMPAECKMRMKNVGRETKTSEGPNSFGKTKIGFCNLSHLAEKQLGEKGGAVRKP